MTGFLTAPDGRAAYNRGVADVLDLARQAADAIEAKGARPLHHGFAIEALRALAGEAEALLLPPQIRAPESAPQPGEPRP